MHDSVRHHLVADVPVAVFLSAGLDSGALLGTMAELGARDTRPSRWPSPSSRATGLDEAPLAAEVAARYGARHIVRTVDRAEFERDLPAILDAMDMPTIDGINTWFVAKAAHEAGIKVALSGLGADECFGGYPSFTDVPRSVHWLRPCRLASRGWARWSRRGVIGGHRSAGVPMHPKAAGVLQYGGDWAGAYLLRRSVFMPWELDDLLDPGAADGGPAPAGAAQPHRGGAAATAGALGDFDRVAALETSLYMRNQLLRDADWAGMAHSVEIRVPYVDPFFLAALPPGDVLARDQRQGRGGRRAEPPLPAASRNRAQDRLRDAGRAVAARRQRRATAGHHRFLGASRRLGAVASGRPAGPARRRPER